MLKSLLRDEDSADVTASVEMDVEPVAAMSAPVEPFGIGSEPQLIPDMPPPPAPAFGTGRNPVDRSCRRARRTISRQRLRRTGTGSPRLDPAPEEPKQSWFQRLKKGLSRSSASLTEGITSIFTKRKLDASMLEELEDILIQADLGVDTAMAITERLSDGRYNKEISPEEVGRSLRKKSRKCWSR